MTDKITIYQTMEAKWQRGEPAIMDGGIGSELQAMGYPPADTGAIAQFHLGRDGALR